jgi:N-6 DNA Methylase
VVDEEALSKHLTRARRKETGAFFTPAPLVDRVLRAVSPFVPEGPLTLVDPACGAGAFLVAAARHWPEARVVGAELDPHSAEQARARVPRATVVEGDALTSPALDCHLPSTGFELWVGNPPYNGTSLLLQDKAAWQQVSAWLPLELPKGTSLREDYVFFLLRAARRLAARPGALAFITSATLLDTFTYAPVREALLQQLALREVIDLGPGAFAGTRVRTCITVWTTARGPACFEGRPFTPSPPEFAFKPPSDEAQALDDAWRAGGATVGELIPVSFPGLKTRFDELLVDDDRAVLLERVRAFCAAKVSELEGFAARFEIPTVLLPKLVALRGACGEVEVSPANVRPFLRYRGPLAMEAGGFCYVERRLIPRGDHRLRGAYDPHRSPTKLVFNQHELPLSAQVLDLEGCVTAYRHSRFAPLEVPARLLSDPAFTRLSAGEVLAPNLTPLGAQWAAQLGSPRAVFEHVAAHMRGEAFQARWAPAFGRSRPPLIAAPRQT